MTLEDLKDEDSTRSSPHKMDDRLTTLLSTLPPSSTYFSLEFFPPKTQAGFSNLQSRLSRMATGLRPLFVTVTWGAGGSTATKSLELAEICQRQLGMPTVLHLTCTNMKKRTVDQALESAKDIGVQNILALRGDPPREEYREDEDLEEANGDADAEAEFVWAIDLVRYIKKKYGDYFCVGVAGYPEGHADESHPEAGKQNVDHDLPYLVDKVNAGADFIMTQLTYDLEAYRTYEERVRTYQNGCMSRIPIIPGLMPIQSYSIVKRITKLSHAKLPTDIARRIESVKSDDEEVKKVGVDILSELVQGIVASPQPQGLPRGLHFYTLNLEKSVAHVLERCQLISMTGDATPESGEDNGVITNEVGTVDGSQPKVSKRRTSSANAQPHNRAIIDQEANNQKSSHRADPSERLSSSPTAVTHQAGDLGSGIPASDPSRQHNVLISEGQGSLGREATWDDFPNGRWGPSHSPAFGEIDGYGPSLKVGPVTARKLWGHPTRREHIIDLFRRHVNGDLDAVPWSDEVEGHTQEGNSQTGGALREETNMIKDDLLRLIEEKGYLTLASQPAVDGVRSDDAVFGWGPKGEGFIFQKAFVEFFCPRQAWEDDLRPKLLNYKDGEVSWMEIDAHGQYECSEMHEDDTNGVVTSKKIPGTSGVNAVTWGVFRGREIVTPTIIESESFRAWGEEAYAIWAEWRRCYPRGSEEEQCLEKLRQDLVLVNVVAQNYIGGHQGEGMALWKILLNREGSQNPA